MPLGGKRLQIGPTQNINFPYVLMGRALHHYDLLSARTHAQRGRLELRNGQVAPKAIDRIDASQRKSLESCFRRLRKGDDPARLCEQLATLIAPLLSLEGEERG